uniref:Uncharacterized protein n=1 Tax=Lepeophtheirus salmonis TaxID=72036 RepID=A0A0K2TEZ7_LEPSM
MTILQSPSAGMFMSNEYDRQ